MTPKPPIERGVMMRGEFSWLGKWGSEYCFPPEFPYKFLALQASCQLNLRLRKLELRHF